MYIRNKIPDRLLRIRQILGCEKQGIIPIVPVTKTAWYAGMLEGVYPEPVKLSGGRTSAWRESDVMAVVNGTYRPSRGGDVASLGK